MSRSMSDFLYWLPSLMMPKRLLLYQCEHCRCEQRTVILVVVADSCGLSGVINNYTVTVVCE